MRLEELNVRAQIGAASAARNPTLAPCRVSAAATARRAIGRKTSPSGRTAGQASRGVRRAAGILSAVTSPAPQISVVIPCLDEEEAVGAVVDHAWEAIGRSGR